jgi:hypothetical protein
MRIVTEVRGPYRNERSDQESGAGEQDKSQSYFAGD